MSNHCRYVWLIVRLIVEFVCGHRVVSLTDNFIQKTKQRYNSPRSLSTKINLADMQTEIKLRPPYQLSAEDLRSVNGFSQHTPSKYKGIGTDHTPDSFTQPHKYRGLGTGQTTPLPSESSYALTIFTLI